MTDRIPIVNNMPADEALAAINANFLELFDSDMYLAQGGGATQAIASGGLFKTVSLTAFVNNTSDAYISANKVYMDNTTDDDTTGLWNAIGSVCWDNTTIGMGRHLRKLRIMQGIVGGPFDYVLASVDQLYDPSCGIVGEAATSYQQIYGQPGFDSDPAHLGYLYLQVWHNAGVSVNLVKNGIQSNILQAYRESNW